MRIREVTPEDVLSITDIYNYYIENTVITFETDLISCDEMRSRILALTNEGFPYLVAEDEDGRIIGYCYAHGWKTKAAYSRSWENTIYLRPDSCHRGTGNLLMETLIQCCRERGVHVLIACITGGNTSSIRFHSSLGFKEASHFHEVGYKHGRWLDVIDMELIL